MLATLSPASADRASKGDADDVAGSLDLKLVHHEHDGTRLVHRVGTYDDFSSESLRLRQNRYIILGFDTDNDFSDDRLLYVFYRDGRLRGEMRDASDEFVGSAEVRRPNARSIKVWVRPALLGGAPGYRWAAYSLWENDGACAFVCLDIAPEATRILHDFTAPTIGLRSFPDPSTKESAKTRFPVSFKVEDRGFSGLASWKLQQRQADRRQWNTAYEGTTDGVKERSVRGRQGRTYEFRVVAVDRHENRRESGRRTVSVPFDDRHRRFEGRYQGRWQSAGRPRDFLGTLRSTGASDARLRFSFRGSYVAWIAKNGDGVARVRIDGDTIGTVDLGDVNGRRKVVFARVLHRGEHTMSIARVGGRINVDGIVIR